MQIISVLAFVSTVAAVVVRQSVTPPPTCALSCLASTNTDGCSITDNSCLCNNAQFISTQFTCIQAACTNPADLQQAETFAQQNCLTVGVTLTATPTPVASSGSSPSSSAASSSAASSSVASSSAASPSAATPSPAKPNSASTFGRRPALLLCGIAALAFTL
ncbi:hypothetical protein K439DRAFT_1631239 [Ramaria rubella]|nr:hypothetical protein K439DRAFT_1631239 [Ramaria rubella]